MKDKIINGVIFNAAVWSDLSQEAFIAKSKALHLFEGESQEASLLEAYKAFNPSKEENKESNDNTPESVDKNNTKATKPSKSLP